MTAFLACSLASGMLLLAAPFLWPASGEVRRPDRLPLVRLRLNQAGFPTVSPAAFVAASVLSVLLGAAVLHALFAVLALSVAAGAVCGIVPFLLLSSRAAARRDTHRAQWPDAVDQLVSAVRSGIGLPDAVAGLAHAGPSATRSAFARFEQNYARSGDFGRCVDLVKRDLADPVADRILETLRMAREVGGSDLVSVLRDLASSLRSEAAVRSELVARQSWITSAARLGIAAPWVVLFLLAARPEAAQAYNSGQGVAVILSGLAVCVLAYRVMRALGRLPEEKRWFG